MGVESQLYTSLRAGEVAAHRAAGEGMTAKPPTSSAHPLPNPSPIKGEGLQERVAENSTRIWSRSGAI